MSTAGTKKGLLEGWFESRFWDTKIKSANVQKSERILGYVVGPFGVMLLQSIVNSYFNQYLTDTLGFTVSRGMWIAGFMVVFPVFSKLLDAITNVFMAKLLDKTVCRQGKLRPWFILSLPITILSIVMMFAIPDMGAKAQAVWVVIAYNLFYSVGYTMWYMAYELSAALSTRNVKQRSGNSIMGQITKNIGTGIISITFPTLLGAVARSLTGGDMKKGYLLTLSIMCGIAIPLTFIQYFFTRERITEERRNAEGTTEDGSQKKVQEASFGEQLKACLKDKYWVMFILMILIYQVLNALKGVSQVYYAGWVVNGNSYGEYAAIQAKFTMISMAPVGPMLFVIVPLIKKFGRTRCIIVGGIVATFGAILAYFTAGHTLPVYIGTALSGVGAMAFVYTMMSFTGDAIDHVEYSQNVRVEGVTAALVGFMHSLANGLGHGLYNLGLMMSGYSTPEQIGVNEEGIALFADQSKAAINWINFSYQGAIGLTALMFVVLFMFFFDIDKQMPKVTKELIERKKAECTAKGIEYISPEEQQRAEIAKQQAEAEEIRIKELKEKCAKNGLNFDEENRKYLEKKAAKAAKKAAKKKK
ncbi:MAG: MFS transporter [Lachnospiraceae bacterium]|nr:MFS transporter [Lachnospiraceae bacterium]